MELWKVFKDGATGRELWAYSMDGSFEGEEENTRLMLAYEHEIDARQIVVTIEER